MEYTCSVISTFQLDEGLMDIFTRQKGNDIV